MTTTHTPGPWELSLAEEKYPFHTIIGARRHVVVCEVDPRGPASNHNPEADARLIAAAPELLEALQIWMKFFDTMPKGQFGGISCDIGLMNEGFIKSARAISKAKGK